MSDDKDAFETIGEGFRLNSEYIKRFHELSLEDQEILVEDLERETAILREYINLEKEDKKKEKEDEEEDEEVS